MSEKCDLTIARLNDADDGKIVRIDACVGARLLSRIEINIVDFAEALMGLGKVPATHTDKRPIQPGRISK